MVRVGTRYWSAPVPTDDPGAERQGQGVRLHRRRQHGEALIKGRAGSQFVPQE